MLAALLSVVQAVLVPLALEGIKLYLDRKRAHDAAWTKAELALAQREMAWLRAGARAGSKRALARLRVLDATGTRGSASGARAGPRLPSVPG